MFNAATRAWRSPTPSSAPTMRWRTRSVRAFGIPHGRANGIFLPHALAAVEDLSNRTNPRMPMISEITELLKAGYYGRDVRPPV